jgi:hypothetical protein
MCRRRSSLGSRGGKDSIDHPQMTNARDDLANAVALLGFVKTTCLGCFSQNVEGG